MAARISTLFAVLCLLSFSACNLPQRISSTPPAGMVLTAAAKTVAVELTQFAVQTPFSPETFFTPVPSQTSLFTPQAPESTAIPTITQSGIPCDRASFITDVTYPDDAIVTAGSTFIKTWRLKNNGSCTWTSEYSLVFVQGDAMGAPASTPFISGIVAPGETVDVAITLTAPAEIRSYQGYFQLRNPGGENFGIGEGASGMFWVKITTAPPGFATAVP